MSQAFEISSCEVCGGKALEPVLDLGKHPLCDDLVPVGDARVCLEYPIEILYCKSCATAHQRFQVPKAELFPKSYHYRSRFTADVLNGMKALVASTEERAGSLNGRLVLDVGCNDGSLLGFFREKGAKTVGVEPTGAAVDAKAAGHPVYNAFFDRETAAKIVAEHGQPAVITFTNVFAHIEDLGGLVAALKLLITPATIIVIENHYLGSVLDGNQFDTFYHEHPRTYSATSFVRIAKSLGVELKGVEFPSRYGGNIRVFMGAAKPVPGAEQALKAVLEKEKGCFERFAVMRANIEAWKTKKGALISSLSPLPAKAFPGRAAILIKLLGLDARTISAVYEKPGSMKIGHYLPGTRIPIRSDDDFFASKEHPKKMLNLAWHISGEIGGYLKSRGFDGELINILSAQDF